MPKDIQHLAKDMEILSNDILKWSKRLVQVNAQNIGEEVINATPVDTGQARLGWVSSIDNPIREIPEIRGSDEGGFGINTIMALNNLKRTVSIFSNRNKSIFITNIVPYLVYLNEGGYSSQAPRLFIDLAIQRAFRIQINLKIQ